MSDTSAFGFGQFVPGFDFLQNLSKTAAQAAPAAGAVPGMSSWIAPTLSIEEIDKRIQELKAVQFWLDQNATALKATIQAMEVQKMTLSTLQSMNVNMADLAKAFTAKPPTPEAAAEAAPEPKSSIFSPKPKPATAPKPEPEPKAEPAPASQPTAEAANDKPAVDPMQWWGALTEQFQGIAAAAMKDVAGEALKAGMTVKQAVKAGTKTGTKSGVKSKPKATPKAPAKVTGKPTARAAAKSAARPAARKRAAP